jgi:hypothetical protein
MNAATILSVALLCLGAAVIVRTLLLGVGGGLGLLLGALLLAGGAARLYLARRAF